MITKTFIVPTFEPRIDLLSLTLRSILNYMGPYDELNVHDDASSNIEDVSRLCHKLIAQFPHLKISVYAHNSNIGLVPNLNRALCKVTTEFFTIFGQDDIAKYQDINFCDELLANNPNTDLFLFRTEFIDIDGLAIVEDKAHHNSRSYEKRAPSIFELAWGWGKSKDAVRYSVHGSLFRTGTMVFDEQFRIEDHPIFLQKASENKLILSSYQSSQYRRHPQQMTARTWLFFFEDLVICWRFLPLHMWVIVASKKLLQRLKIWLFT